MRILRYHSTASALLLCAVLVACAASCKDKQPDTNGTPPPDTAGKGAQTGLLPKADTSGLPAFNAGNAYNHVAAQVGFGPRNPGSPGARQNLQYMTNELKKYAEEVEGQPFTHVGYKGETFTLTNVFARFNKAAAYRVLLVAHWDTRPRADEDPDPAKHNQPIVGANDGASGVGVLLELARVMKEHPLPSTVGVDILLVDGEDYGDSRVDGLNRYFLGSRRFAVARPKDYKPAFGILLDMVGDANPQFMKEPNSINYAPDVVEMVWKAAGDLELHQFLPYPGQPISDDHGPLNDGGIRTIDIIDGQLVGALTNDERRKYWHTTGDTMDKISAETLGAVGKLLAYVVYKVVPAMAAKPA